MSNLYSTVVFIILLILLNGAIYYSFSQMMYKSELERTIAQATRAADGIGQIEGEVPHQEVLRAYMPINGMLQIVNNDGSPGTAVVDPNHQYLHKVNVQYYDKQVQEITSYDRVTHTFASLPIVWRNGEVANLQITVSLQQTDEILSTLRIVQIIVTLLAIIPVLLSSRFLSNLITRPITSMIQTMREIRESGQFRRIAKSKESKDELSQMAETFNEMIDLLELNYEKQGQFISNASHELNTPLTVIESYASLLKRRGQEQPELFAESIQAIHSEAIRMKSLTEQLLNLARNDKPLRIELEEIALADVVAEMVRTIEKSYQRKIELEVEGEVTVQTDLQKFKQLFYIFLDNARKYSEDTIKVRIKTLQREGVVEIIDYGIGIPAPELEKVFDRFYRVDKARTRKTGGFGLGLSLATDLAEAMGAKISLESVEGLGTTAKIILPLASSH
ncbi:HAMP domain-containing sensor histidine kinase [Robertmurraya sp. DFI.2.37]|uniref:sensor histidine kinase n=1 Tax=Robertmurraya sp. DFI.2.37 TaxID=3031819 RepID=UPI001CD9B669|nr:HAMP domain-containing sensor histidine kinase [Robertmurraya sp. DFI.2.37]MDF1509765.1 HAMP domain-containing sensor histidine kinase [Robertmurraya sp. DFI.2.37]